MLCHFLTKNRTGIFTVFCLLFLSFFVSSSLVSDTYADTLVESVDFSDCFYVNDMSPMYDITFICDSYTFSIAVPYDYFIVNMNSTFNDIFDYDDIKFFFSFSTDPINSSNSSLFYYAISDSLRFNSYSSYNYYFNSFGFTQQPGDTSFSYNTMVSVYIDPNDYTISYDQDNLIDNLTLSFDFYSVDSSPSEPCVSPSGQILLNNNGTYDVTNYSQAIVNVPPEVIQGDYHNDLINITNGIYVCAGTILVIYFFYCIYRLIIKNSGAK